MPINLTSITPLPDPPLKTSPDNFAERGDAFLGALPGLATEFNSNILGLNEIISGLYQSEPIAGYSALVTYGFPTTVAGSDGYSYRCIGVDVLDDDPVGSVTGDWVGLNIKPAAASSIPVGAVVPFLGGYFTDSANTGFTSVLGNTAAAINARVNDDGWYVCDGAELNDSSSSFMNGAGRYLPNLTDERFLMGDSAAGGIGGDNSMNHNHTLSHTHAGPSHSHTTSSHTLSTNEMPSHAHSFSDAQVGNTATKHLQTGSSWSLMVASDTSGYAGGGYSHSHGSTGSAAGTTGASSISTSGTASLENRPKFLSCFYIIKVS